MCLLHGAYLHRLEQALLERDAHRQNPTQPAAAPPETMTVPSRQSFNGGTLALQKDVSQPRRSTIAIILGSSTWNKTAS